MKVNDHCHTTNVLSKLIEKYNSFYLAGKKSVAACGNWLVFIDGLHLSNSLLNNLVKNLRENDDHHVR